MPVATSWLWRFYFGSFKATFQDLSSVVQNLQFKYPTICLTFFLDTSITLIADCAFGFVVAGAIVVLLLGLSLLMEYMQTRGQENGDLNDIPVIHYYLSPK